MKNLCLIIKITTKLIKRKSQQYNSPYLSQLLNIMFQYKSEVQIICAKEIIFIFPWIFEYGNSAILELGIMGTKSITVCWT
jgi:hypothetical protein